MSKRFLLFICCLSVFIPASWAADCIECICQVESNCKPLGCEMDQGSLSCGYFQIKRDYYFDCNTPGKEPGEDLDVAWKRCASDYGCSIQCIQNYVGRYGSGCNISNQCEKMARLHNGGPNGCNNQGTVGYWNRVKQCLG